MSEDKIGENYAIWERNVEQEVAIVNTTFFGIFKASATKNFKNR